jgi:hypothetical protein
MANNAEELALRKFKVKIETTLLSKEQVMDQGTRFGRDSTAKSEVENLVLLSTVILLIEKKKLFCKQMNSTVLTTFRWREK